MCPQLAPYAMNLHFSGHTSSICIQTVEAKTILGVSFCVSCIVWFLDDFPRFFCESLISNVAHASLSSFLGPSFSHLLQDMCCSLSQRIFDGSIRQNGSCSLLLVSILTLSGSGFRKRLNVLSRRMCFFLWSRCWWSCRINQHFWWFTATVGSHTRGRSICYVSPRPKFIMKISM